MPTISDCLKHANTLADSCEQPLREAQALLAYCANLSLATMYTWPDKAISQAEYDSFTRCLVQRAKGYPLAYICGYKEFWSLNFAVEEGVLIPRPETELLVEQCVNYASDTSGNLLDLGTGTGAIALAFATEKPGWQITAVDANPQAVALAKHNAASLGITNTQVLASNWYSAVAGQRFNVIVANPPYIDGTAQELLGDGVKYEPSSALVAAENGMSDLKHIVAQAPNYLLPQAYLLLEHGYDQGAACRQVLNDAGFSAVETLQDYAGLDRISLGRYLP